MTRSQARTDRRVPGVALAAGAATAGSLLGVGAGSLGAAALFARRVLTPDRRRPDDARVVAVGDRDVLLTATADTRVRGRFGLWLNGGTGHARVGDILDVDPGSGLVRRVIESVDSGSLHAGPVRWNTYYYWAAPDVSLGLATQRVQFRAEVGVLDAWVVPPPGASPGADWAILVHGRGARREETLRALHALGRSQVTAVIPQYRNDEGAPAGPRGRYTLGVGEWRDLEAAMSYAIDHGARRLILMGWSMGGAIVLQTLARSELAAEVDKVVLDSPVVDWADVLTHHARLHKVPSPIGALGQTLMGRPWGRHLVGVDDVIDLASTDWVRRADELATPILLIHSADDEFVPVGPSKALAHARPDLVTFAEWTQARHCQEWNTDVERWESLVEGFIRET